MCIPCRYSRPAAGPWTKLNSPPAPPARKSRLPIGRRLRKLSSGDGRLSCLEFRRATKSKGRETLERKSGDGEGRIDAFSVSQLGLCRVRGSTSADPLRGHPRRCTLIAPRTCAAAAAFACLVAVTAKHRTIAAWFKWNSGWLAAAGADHRCSMGWCRTITGASPTLFALLCLTARLAALGGRITAFLKERLIRSGERKILSTITARKLNVSGHVCPLRVVLVAIVHTTW